MQDGTHYRDAIFAGNFLLRGSCVAMAGEICVATRALMVLFYLSMLGGFSLVGQSVPVGHGVLAGTVRLPITLLRFYNLSDINCHKQ